jgi:DNA modification methylase
MSKPQHLSEAIFERIEKIANATTRERGYTRTYYSYPAKFLSHLPRELIKMFSLRGDLIYDAYCGGGTTGLEAMLLERRFVGYDINPFAILISKVKTRRLDVELIRRYRQKVTDLRQTEMKQILDDEDESLLGQRISLEISKIAANIDKLSIGTEYEDFFKLALIHSVKIVGRRDFKGRILSKNQSSITNFMKNAPVFPSGASIIPLFKKKVNMMIKQMATLPISPVYVTEFVLGSNFRTHLADQSADLIVTSPPYKDLDVEYLQIQIQRPESHKSKRSNVIAKIIGVEPVERDKLCGYRAADYWENLIPSLKECYRVSKSQTLAFFWIGFKTAEDFERFKECLQATGFSVLRPVSVTLSNDRAASSRSIHHGRETHMLKNDWLFVTRRN